MTSGLGIGRVPLYVDKIRQVQISQERQDVKQAGATGIVTALHEVGDAMAWKSEDIN